MLFNAMTAHERRAVASLSSILALRMIGLLMVLPVFALYAQSLPGSSATLTGIAIGIYGFFQAVFQIPLGALSDKLGRKKIILFGLSLFIFGSLLAGFASSIYAMIIGRSLQGAGAIGSTTMAMMADLTREEQRTKAMAIAGITIGLSFSIAMILGPVFTRWINVNDLFFLAALFGLIAIVVLFKFAPTPLTETWQRVPQPQRQSFLKSLQLPQLLNLSGGILCLHAIFTASFVIIPISFLEHLNLNMHDQWKIFLPSLLGALAISFLLIGTAERKQSVKIFFQAGILMLGLSLLLLWLNSTSFIMSGISLTLFFSGFSLLEAFLPSLVSRTAPAARKGSALGIYSCAQFFGIFVGGLCGGWLFGKYSYAGVYLFCTALALLWFLFAFFLKPPHYLVTHFWRLLPEQRCRWEVIATKLRAIPGMVEVTFIPEDGVAILKMERSATTHPDYLHLKDHTQ